MRKTRRTIGRAKAEELAAMIDATRAELCKIECNHPTAEPCPACKAFILLGQFYNKFTAACF